MALHSTSFRLKVQLSHSTLPLNTSQSSSCSIASVLPAMSSSKPAGRGASRHWSDSETSALVDAWGQQYLARNRVSLRDNDWRQVCGAVNDHRAATGRRFDRSVSQCQWRLYALKSQYKKEVAKGQPTSGWRHFAQLGAFLAGPDDGPPPGFAGQMPPASVKEEKMEEVVEEEEVEEKEEVEEASGSVARRTVPAKRRFSSLQDILDRSGGPPPGFPPRMPATPKKAKEELKEEVEVGGEGPAHGAATAGCLPGEVVTKLAEVYWSVEMERLSVEREKMAMERERRAAKVEAENQLGETDEATTTE